MVPCTWMSYAPAAHISDARPRSPDTTGRLFGPPRRWGDDGEEAPREDNAAAKAARVSKRDERLITWQTRRGECLPQIRWKARMSSTTPSKGADIAYDGETLIVRLADKPKSKRFTAIFYCPYNVRTEIRN